MVHPTHRQMVTVVLAGLVSIWLGQPAAAQRATEEHKSFLVASPYGVDNFHAYCSPCHGRDGTGHGPVAKALKTAPPDLTTIVARNHGVFPRGTIRDIIAAGQHRRVSLVHPAMVMSMPTISDGEVTDGEHKSASHDADVVRRRTWIGDCRVRGMCRACVGPLRISVPLKC
jgi:mono/diheme cytochrome c family protein